MSLQAMWTLYLIDPASWVNGLALFLAAAGAWLLLATRVREQRAAVRLLGNSDSQPLTIDGRELDEATLRLNRFFYHFGFACLLGALTLSGFSTQL